MAKFWGQFKAVMKKNIIIKMRNRKQTLQEIIMPLYFIAILVVIKLSVKPEENPQLTGMPENSLYAERLFSVSKNDLRLLVAPDDSYIQDLMTEAVAVFQAATNMTTAPSIQYFQNRSEAENSFSQNSTSVWAGILFNFANNASLDYLGGGNLTYAIRKPKSDIPDTATSNLYTSQGSCRGQYEADDLKGLFHSQCDVNKYLWTGFSALQAAIDTAIIRKFGGNPNFEHPGISVQMLPKPLFQPDSNYIQVISSIYFVIAYSPLISFLAVNLVAEKEKKIKEGMRMMGLKSSVFWLSWGVLYGVMIVAVTAIVTIIAAASKFFAHSNVFVFFLLLMFYGLSIIGLAFMITPFLNKAQVAGTLASFGSIILSLLYLMVSMTRETSIDGGSVSYKISVPVRWLLSLLSPVALSLGIDQAIYLDLRGGMNFDTAADGDFPLYGPLIMLIVDSILYFLLAMYFDNVIPGEYGPRQKPWFLFTKDFWCSGKKRRGLNVDMNGHYIIEKDYGSFISNTENEADAVEPVPVDMKSNLAVKISKLCKVFESKKKTVKAVNELSLDIYLGQITAILGHNGAGKTTLLNILTGLTEPTSGQASVLGLDVSNTNDMEIIRQKTGICPQHNILFDDLTCVEHLQLFAGIKGVPDDQIEKEVKDALDSVGLADQKLVRSANLSGGQKRKLSVAIAIIGDPKIIFLDEPTAGMDPYSRRHLWSVLKEKKKGRVILLTTHFMDEADILADRKAVVSKGSLRCCGSSLFLKNRFGLGYHLNMVVEHDTDHNQIDNLVSQYIPGSEVGRVHGKELDITLPHTAISNFASLFSALEERSDGVKSLAETLGIKSYGVSMTTLEEVFLKLEEQEEEADSDDESINVQKNGATAPKSVDLDMVETDPMLNAEIITGSQLFWQRLWALCKIKFLMHLRSPAGTIFQVFIPVALVIAGLVLSKTLGQAGEDNTAPVPLLISSAYYANLTNLTSQGGRLGQIPNLLLQDTANSTESALFEASLSAVFGVDTYDNSYFTDETKLLQAGVFPHYLGINIKHMEGPATYNSTYKAMYNDSAIHSIPAIVNVMSNGILAAVSGALNNIITVFNYPWPQTTQQRGWDNAAFTSTLIIGMAFALIPGGFGIQIVRDRQDKVRSQLRVSGLPFSLYWLSSFIVEFLKFLIPAVLVIIVIYIVGVESLMPGGAIFSFILVCLTYMPATILFAYFVSFMFDKWETAQAVQPMIFFLVGYLPYIPVSMIDLLSNATTAGIIHIVCCALDPAYCIFGAIYYIDKVYRMAKYRGMENEIEFGDYFKFDNYIVITYIMSLLHIFLFMFLLRVMDIRSTGGDLSDACCPGSKGRNSVIPNNNADVNHKEDIDVAEERTRVRRLQEGGASQVNYSAWGKTPVALCENLRKEFTKDTTCCGCCNKDACKKGATTEDKVKVACRNVTFAVDSGEVFGLLGPNGAGKTTCLNMMTADVHPDKGKVIVGGYDVRSSLSQAFEAMGYCPQHDALWEPITLQEHMECYALVRGIPKDEVKDVVAFFIENLKLQEHAKKHSKKLSGGTKRKLSYCISMLGKPSIVLLDEPSTGMDPQSKRFLWDTISSSFENTDRGSILTTHYMEEADALCSRIAIMVNGRLECLGASTHLKNKYGSGYLLEVKLTIKDQSTSLDDRLEGLHQYIISKFPGASMMEQFSERVQYKVPKSSVTSLSRAFTVLEEGKLSHDIEEYSFSQSTLEQVGTNVISKLKMKVFLEFAKRQLEEGQTEREVEIGRQLSRALSVEGKHERDTGSYRL